MFFRRCQRWLPDSERSPAFCTKCLKATQVWPVAKEQDVAA